MVYLETGSTDPAYNLAFEEFVLTHRTEGDILILWQNDNAVIIGRNQNTAEEIDQGFVDAHGIRVVRRNTGGGAVYHDLGNLNYSFITDAGASKSAFTDPVIRTLRSLGLDAEVSGRNDILVSGKKVSGTAQQVSKGRVLHHGTLLFDSDSSMITGALTPDPGKFQSKGVKSVRSRVGNIRSFLKTDMTLSQFRVHLAGYLLKDIPHSRFELTEEDRCAVEAIRSARYGTWQWNYGASPACDIVRRKRVEGAGSIQAHITLEKGCIRELVFRGDYFSTEDPAALGDLLRGCPLTREALTDALSAVDVGRYISGLTQKDLQSILLDL